MCYNKNRKIGKKGGMPVAAKRLWLLDALRGAALVNMLAYHALYDWVYVFGHTGGWYDISAPGCHIWQQYICWSFLLLSGYSATLARRPLKNGLVVAGCAAVLTVATAVCMPSQAIWFGVLHLNAAAMLLTCLLRPLLQACPAGPGLAVCAALFALTNQLPYGYLGFEGLRLVRMPASLYQANLFWLGLPDLTKFSSADYFPLVRVVFGAAVAAAHGAGPGGAAPAGVCGAAYPGGVHGAPAGAVRRAVAVACAVPVTKC